jgi:hypothetical protein
MDNNLVNTWSTIVKNMLNNRQKTWSTIVQTHAQQSPKTWSTIIKNMLNYVVVFLALYPK